MSEQTKKRGGAGRGQGRKQIKPGEGTVIIRPSLSESQAAKYERLGGHPWLRSKIDEAPEPEKENPD